jgi:enamine deaminase RidA (YjgF/YER057c/UK114 family)
MPKRETLEVEGLGHANPIPLAVKIGNMVFTGTITGADESGTISPDPEQQIAQIFRNIRRIVEKAGGTVDDIAKLDVSLKDMAHRAIVNREWVAMFPDEHDRPARHSSQADLPGNQLIQVELIAVL